VRWLKNGSLAFAEGLACAVGAKANVPFAGWHKIELKKMCGGENKKYRRVGNECRLTRCPFVISFLCLWSPVKMVYFFLVLVVCLLLSGRPLHLLPTFRVYAGCVTEARLYPTLSSNLVKPIYISTYQPQMA
jgi:hypothetical protein